MSDAIANNADRLLHLDGSVPAERRSFLLPIRTTSTQDRLDDFIATFTALEQNIPLYYRAEAKQGTVRDVTDYCKTLVRLITHVQSDVSRSILDRLTFHIKEVKDLMAEWERDNAATTRDVDRIALICVETLATATMSFDAEGNQRSAGMRWLISKFG